MPPKGFQLRWNAGRDVNTRNGPRRLFQATMTPMFQAACSANMAGKLRELGFSRDTYSTATVNFWHAGDLDAAAARRVIGEVYWAIIHRNRATRGARIAEAREKRERREAALAGIKRIARESSWAVHKNFVELAKRWAQATDMPDDVVPEIERVIKLTDATVARAEERLKEEPPEDLRAFCEAPDVRAGVTAALRHITGNDSDWATELNEIGWSKATTLAGHVLARQDALSAEHAAHAMKILRIHHTQVPDDLRGVLRIR